MLTGIRAGTILKDKNLTEFAIKTVNLILQHCYDKEKGLYHYFDGKPHVHGLLIDNIQFLSCLLDAYLLSKDEKYLSSVKDISEFILNKFYDNENHGFFDRIASIDDFGTLKHRDKQFLDNSFCAVVFLKLSEISKDIKYRDIAKNTILFFSDDYAKYSYFSSAYALAVQKLNK
jgi:uncharacterized protein